MRYFSQDLTCISTECDKCKRILQIRKRICEEKDSGYSLKNDCHCPCGNVFNFISGKSVEEKLESTYNFIQNPPKNARQSRFLKEAILFMPILLTVLLIIFGVISCSDEAEKSMQLKIDHEQNEFRKQLNQDPRTWDKAQDDRYNNFVENRGK